MLQEQLRVVLRPTVAIPGFGQDLEKSIRMSPEALRQQQSP